MKNAVKYSHWRKPEMMLLALSLVYLNPWVTLLSALSWSMTRTERELNTDRYTKLGKESIHQFDPKLKRLSGTSTNLLTGRLFLKKKEDVAPGS